VQHHYDCVSCSFAKRNPRGLSLTVYTSSMEDLPITLIANDTLEPATFPKRRDPFDTIVKFALTFDGYAHFGMDKCAELANTSLSNFYHSQVVPEDINELRACLFFEARRWTLYKKEPDNKGLIYRLAKRF
jgi:uncharacterized protein YozE (UPF0346 family)